MRNPVTTFNQMVMRNPLKWLMFTAGVTCLGVAVFMLAAVVEDPVGSGLWWFALVLMVLFAAATGLFAWFFIKFHGIEKRLEQERQ